MSKIEQFVYTASPWGKSDPGWMVFQKSSGIDDSTIGAISPYYRYERPDGWDGAPAADALSSYPVQFVFAKPESFGGDFLLVQTTFTGRRWYDPRPGDWYVHGFRVPSSIASSGCDSTESLFRFFRSDSIQREYPEDLRDKAMLIGQKKIPWVAPPDLPMLDSLAGLEPNSRFEKDTVFSRIPEDAWPKLGALLAACVKRGDSAKALVFDATKSESLDTMAAILALMPLRSRTDAQFSTYFHSENVRETKADDTFHFYGTVREGESADPDTGLYGALPEGGPDFRSREDVELFKRMVDAGGTELKEEDFDNLVLCWEVAAGRKTDVESLRKAVQFAKRFPRKKDEPGMDGEVISSLKNGCPDPVTTVVAWFELDLAEFKAEAIEVCENCVQNDDSDSFSHYLGILGNEEARRRFLEQAALTGVPFVGFWIQHGADVCSLVPESKVEGEKANFDALRKLVEDFSRVCNDAKQGKVSPEQAGENLEIISKMEARFGSEVEGMEDARRELEYLKALNGVHTYGDVPSFVASAKDLEIDDETRIKLDVLSRASPEELSAVDLWKALHDGSYSAIVDPEEVIQLALDAAKRRGKADGDRRAEEADRRAENRIREAAEDADAGVEEMKRKAEMADSVAARYRLRAKLAFPLALLAFLGGIAVGLFGPRCLPNRNEVVKETESAVEAGDVSGAESSKTNERPPSRMKRTEPSQPGVSADVPTDVIGTGSSIVSQDGSPGFQSDGMLKGGQSRGGGSVGQPLVVGKVPSQTEPNPKQFSQTRPGTADLQKNAATTTDRKAGSPQMEENELADPDIRRGELKNDSRDGVAAADESKSSSDEGKAE